MLLTMIVEAVVVAGGVIAFLGSRKPDMFRVVRSARFNAPPARIYPHLIDLKLGQDWSPWVEMEPQADYRFDAKTQGIGAGMSWSGKKVGVGKLEITDYKENEYVTSRLEFFKPFAGVNTVHYTLTPTQDGGAIMEWSMEGKSKFINKVMSVLMDCDKICGDQFIKGMDNLKAIVEKPAGESAAV